jgi:hypothetical protein
MSQLFAMNIIASHTLYLGVFCIQSRGITTFYCFNIIITRIIYCYSVVVSNYQTARYDSADQYSDISVGD